ncbi:MAG: NADH-quinone oxidoreductase subunit C [Methanoregula sp.]|nr:NADH-quinone oxidoreductase subunit C [Methanoregula sp.]
MKSEEVARLILGRYPGTDVRVSRERRIMVYIPSGLLIGMLAFLKDQGVTHISTITAVDRIKEHLFELLYHLYWENNEISVRIEIPRENPVVPTVTAVLPGALTYEREIQDMFGIRVDQIPNPERLLLPDNWPAGEYPLRKDYVVK